MGVSPTAPTSRSACPYEWRDGPRRVVDAAAARCHDGADEPGLEVLQRPRGPRGGHRLGPGRGRPGPRDPATGRPRSGRRVPHPWPCGHPWRSSRRSASLPSSHVLDLGSGLGGPARTLAELTGCTVTGIDLTPEFCEVATALSEWTGLSDRTRFQVGDATATGLPDAAVDAAMTVHVAMNIPDKAALYAEAFRVLRPGGRFVVYDVLQGEGGDVQYPVPWANDPSTSFLATPEDMRAAAPRSRFRGHLGSRLLRREPRLVPAGARPHRTRRTPARHLRDLPRRRVRADGRQPGRQPRRAADPHRHVHLRATAVTVCVLACPFTPAVTGRVMAVQCRAEP